MADQDSRSGARYATPAILEYVDRVHAGHDAILEAAFTAPAREDMPAIQVGRSEGRLLELLLRLVGARKVVEVGTLAGYSALRILAALPRDGHLYTLELDPRHARVAEKAITEAGSGDRATVLVGEAQRLLPGLGKHGPFDAVFLDADKAGYAGYGEWATKNLRRGGLLIADNVYLFGRLLDDSPDAVAMRSFHEASARDFDSVTIPTPDGLLLGVRR
jgi:caffeoyl-CoA O-methyltransferase